MIGCVSVVQQEQAIDRRGVVLEYVGLVGRQPMLRDVPRQVLRLQCLIESLAYVPYAAY